MSLVESIMMRRDRRVIGNYLRKRDNLFARMVSGVNTTAFFQPLQAAGAIRQDIDMEQIKEEKDTEQMIGNGATNDNR